MSNALRLPAAKSYEVHEHSFISGPRANRGMHLVHSHEGGGKPHQHEPTGPACYTIDKDEWKARTGLKGGGRKVFAKAPSGEQLPVVELEDWQKSFEVIVDESAARMCAEQSVGGAGIAPAARMVLGFKMAVAS